MFFPETKNVQVTGMCNTNTVHNQLRRGGGGLLFTLLKHNSSHDNLM
jgi:hypothetical protein